MDAQVKKYLQEATQWQKEIKLLRKIVLESGVDENFKWSKLCYSFEENNIAIIQPFKACLGLMFFKGKLLEDRSRLLVANGPHSQSASRLEFRSEEDIDRQKKIVLSYIKEAIQLEKTGKKVERNKNSEPIPVELKKIFDENPKLKKAFLSLTPGRQRAYILHFSGAKQSATRVSRIEKCASKILAGKGLNE